MSNTKNAGERALLARSDCSMRIVMLDPQFPERSEILDAADLLKRGRLVAFPTETVYGLGANALDATAVGRIYAAKGRPDYNPLIVHVADAASARAVTAEWPDRAQALADTFWPGPLTIVLPKRPAVPDGVTAGLPSVAVRVPSHPIAHALIAAANIPVAAPSANRSMALSPTTAQHVADSLGDRVDLILDGGPTTVGIESTVVDLTGDTPRILRPGMISAPEIERVIGPLGVASTPSGEQARQSPGMLDRHYSPRARLILADAEDVERAMLGFENSEGLSISAPAGVRMPSDPAAYAARLYDQLHALDARGVEVIVVERVPGGAAWDGIRDRLERAAR
jgi:L-threonylcarbamoyladenylate synthase